MDLIAANSVRSAVGRGCRTRAAAVVINARVATSPGTLQSHVEAAVAAACAALNATGQFQHVQCLSPGRPVPTHRYSTT